MYDLLLDDDARLSDEPEDAEVALLAGSGHGGPAESGKRKLATATLSRGIVRRFVRQPKGEAREPGGVIELGGAWMQELDRLLVKSTHRRTSKSSAVISAALSELGLFPPPSDAYLELATRRVLALCANGSLVGVGDLRRPRRSEVQLPPQAGPPPQAGV